MEVVINHETKRIKNGWAIRAPQLGLTAHGYSEETARLNLERGIRLFLQPFYRSGTLGVEVASMGLMVKEDGDGEEMIVTLE